MSETTNNGRPGTTRRVLLVDDHDPFREALGVVLEHRAGFDESVRVGSLAAARRVIDDRRAGRFDLAVVDLDLSDGGGYALLEELRAASPGVCVIGVTASPEAGPRARALRAGAKEVFATSTPGEEIVAAATKLGG